MTTSRIVKQMKSDWNVRATTDSRYYIASWNKNWTTKAFLESGLLDVQKFTEAFFMDNCFDPSDKTMLEIGCGVGRMTFAFAQKFKIVHATDISPEMLKKGSVNLINCENVCLSLGSGMDLTQFADNSFDFCFSYLVLQHIPDPNITKNYLNEITRVLKPGGLFKIHLRSRRLHFLFRKIWQLRRLIYRFWPEQKLPVLDTHQSFDYLEREKIERCETWVGSSIPYLDLKSLLAKNQLIAQINSAGVSGTVWIYGSKYSPQIIIDEMTVK